MFNLNQSISQIGKKDNKSESDSSDEESFERGKMVIENLEKIGDQIKQVDQKIDQFNHRVEDLQGQLGGAQNATEDTKEKWKEVLDVLSENQSQFQNNLSQQQKEFQKSSIDGILDSHQKQLEAYQIQGQRFEKQFQELGAQFLKLQESVLLNQERGEELKLQESVLLNQERGEELLKRLEQIKESITDMKEEMVAQHTLSNQKTDQITHILDCNHQKMQQSFENQNNTLKVLEVQNTRSSSYRDEDQDKINKIMTYLESFGEQVKALSEGIQKNKQEKKDKDLQNSGGKTSISSVKPFGFYHTESSYNVNAKH